MDDRYKILEDIEIMRRSFGPGTVVICRVIVGETNGVVYEAYEADARILSPVVDIPIFNEDGLTLISFPNVFYPEFIEKVTQSSIHKVYVIEQRTD